MRNVYLELIRGIAALVVFSGHITLYINGFREVLGKATMLVNWGTEAVIVFFLLSGTVIRLSMDAKPKSKLEFIQKRVARILPLYVVAIILTILITLIARNVPSLSIVIGNLLFLQTLQGYICPTIWANMPLWSLSFEVFFYLIYAITIGKHQQKLLLMWFIISIFTIIIQWLFPLSGLFGHLTIMFAYSSIWLLGYYLVDISKYIKFNLIQSSVWIGLLPMTSRLNFSDEYFLAAKHFIVSCTIIPLFIYLINQEKTFPEANKGIKWKWFLWITVYSVILIFNFHSQSLLISKIIYAILPFLIIFILSLHKNKLISIHINQEFSLFIGQISYALYIIHTPVMYAVNFLSLHLSIKISLSVIIPLIFAYILEYYVHPPIARKIIGCGKRI
ncbi:acyltransferase [Nostoc sp. FACHB-190]|uniref:acyltransferase family protein n=1 Tax=Nostoc sp. FACHB-190 TaxID=2692838 RepID=UPI0016870422|nr:acyltransferase family protein [Nostoc sp. FACHB-190]MBD2297293.1 acyltransferase [Nostoc sp. FACHB-190]